MKTFLLLFFCCWTNAAFAQQEPEFKMPIWFEDSIGNKDTIWVGGDPSASSQVLNPQFGELQLTMPFDSVFEVRAVHGDDNTWKTSKTIIENHEMNLNCALPLGSRIMVNSKYPPVKASWDTSLLKAIFPCNINTILTPDTRVFLIQNWWEARIIYCMMTRDHVFEDFVYQGFNNDHWLERNFQVEGIGTKKLRGFYFVGFWDAPYCYTTLSNNEPDFSSYVTFSPNPFTDHLNIDESEFLKIKEISVFDLSGKAIEKMTINELQANDFSAYDTGVYILRLTTENGKQFATKLVKI